MSSEETKSSISRDISSIKIKNGWLQSTKSYYIIGIIESWFEEKDGYYPKCFVAAIPHNTDFPVKITRKWMETFPSTSWGPNRDPFPELVKNLTTNSSKEGESVEYGSPPARTCAKTLRTKSSDFNTKEDSKLFSANHEPLDENRLYRLVY